MSTIFLCFDCIIFFRLWTATQKEKSTSTWRLVTTNWVNGIHLCQLQCYFVHLASSQTDFRLLYLSVILLRFSWTMASHQYYHQRIKHKRLNCPWYCESTCSRPCTQFLHFVLKLFSTFSSVFQSKELVCFDWNPIELTLCEWNSQLIYPFEIDESRDEGRKIS